jgi:thioredoxin-dependent peroxiredoxin
LAYKAGEIADNFFLKNQNGEDFELYKNLNKNLLLVFYPRDNSLVCSKQLKNYSENFEYFEEAEIRIIGINNGSPEEHLMFCSDKGLDLVLLSDPHETVISKFGALYPFGIVKRKLVLINRSAEVIFTKNLPPFSYWNYKQIIGILRKNEFYK